ncbi:hypothetical protein ASPCAL06009 [Aspergillus calidoustus]|uniref:Uncharacterized protein n=1 Tax=Aspergillus calidoustus TaxID=454130 RepID=A0A0U4Z5A7_ASPCI|nr:hypothetical protein ASPCAL06009 [Aspergillus calidoustus]
MSIPSLIHPLSPLLLLLLLYLAPLSSAFQKSECNAYVQTALANGTLSANSSIFHRSSTNSPFSQPENIILTLPGCKSTCGAGTSFYDDVGPRLSTWLIPILLLIGNMHMARLGNEKYAALLHFLGDPIDTMWSLLTTAEVWSRAHSLAERTIPKAPGEQEAHYKARLVDVATLFAAIEELEGGSADRAADHFHTTFSAILASRKPSISSDAFYHLVKETANELSDSRSAGLRRAGIAVFAYFYHVIAGFVDVIGGESSSPPGGRIGTSMFISWLIPAVLVSNALGGYASRRTALRIMERFVKVVSGEGVEDYQMFSADKRSSLLSSWMGRGSADGGPSRTTTTDFYASQQWSGSIYCYRPRKILFRGGHRDTHPLTLFVLALLPLLISTTTSVTLIWVTPTIGFDCRSLMMVAISCLWLLSCAITFLTYTTRLADGVYHYRLTLIKDALIGLPVLGVIVLSSCGIFNSCLCWSALFSRRGGAYVVLDDRDERGFNARTWYPALVGACLGLQMVVFFVMGWMMRHGEVIFGRDEEKKQEDWLETHVRRGHMGSLAGQGKRGVQMHERRASEGTGLLGGRV